VKESRGRFGMNVDSMTSTLRSWPPQVLTFDFSIRVVLFRFNNWAACSSPTVLLSAWRIRVLSNSLTANPGDPSSGIPMRPPARLTRTGISPKVVHGKTSLLEDHDASMTFSVLSLPARYCISLFNARRRCLNLSLLALVEMSMK